MKHQVLCAITGAALLWWFGTTAEAQIQVAEPTEIVKATDLTSEVETLQRRIIELEMQNTTMLKLRQAGATRESQSGSQPKKPNCNPK